MNITSTSNQPQTNPAFKGHIVVDLEHFSDANCAKIIAAVKRDIGNGLVPKNFVFEGDNIIHKIFVGFNPKKIIIALGNDVTLRKMYGPMQTCAKCRQINKPIYDKLKGIMQNSGIELPDHYLNIRNTRTGSIKLDNKKGVLTVKVIADDYKNSGEYTLYSYQKQQDGSFQYKDYEKFTDPEDTLGEQLLNFFG